ncbi:MAG: OmpA family protein [Myxococcota bacterium]
MARWKGWLPRCVWGVLLVAGACSHTPPPSQNVHFDTGKHEPHDAHEYVTIGRTVEIMRSDDKIRLLLVGHTDSVGDEDDNRDLAFRRAEQVSQLITDSDSGLTSRIRTAYHGESSPIASNDTEDGRALNRRVELFFYYPKNGQSDAVLLQAEFNGKLEFEATLE